MYKITNLHVIQIIFFMSILSLVSGYAFSTEVFVGKLPDAPKKTIRYIQELLKEHNYYDGKLDGLKGPRTEKAIKEFKETRRLEVNTDITVEFYYELEKKYMLLFQSYLLILKYLLLAKNVLVKTPISYMIWKTEWKISQMTWPV